MSPACRELEAQPRGPAPPASAEPAASQRLPSEGFVPIQGVGSRRLNGATLFT